MSILDEVEKAMSLATEVGDAIAQRFGLSEAQTFAIAKNVAQQWVAAEKHAVTEARNEALAKASAAGRVSRKTDSDK